MAVATNASTIIGSFDAATSGLLKPTIVWTRGQVSIAPDVFSADVDIVGAFGIGIVSDQAFAAGAGSIPRPFTQSDWDGWFVWRSFSMRFEFADATGFRLVD